MLRLENGRDVGFLQYKYVSVNKKAKDEDLLMRKGNTTQNVRNKKETKQLPNIIKWFFILLAYAAALIFLVFFLLKYYKPVNINEQVEANIADILWNELGNTVTIVSGVVTWLVEYIAERGRKVNVFSKRLIAVSSFILFNFCRVANAINMSVFWVSLICFVFWVATTIIIMVHTSNSVKIKIKKDIAIKTILGTIKNKKILSVQLFEINEKQEGEYSTYTFNFLDGFIQGDKDVNGILSATYIIKKEYISELELVLIAYQKLVETGEDEDRTILLNSIQSNKEKLLEQLRKIESVETVDKEGCCLARLVIIYLTLEQRLTDENFSGIVAPKGILGVDSEIENKLFTFVRTGILGPVFFGDNDIYKFEYVKDGIKNGRQYCAFQLSNNITEKKIMCMIVLKEPSKFSKDVLEVIKSIETKLNNQFNLYYEETV